MDQLVTATDSEGIGKFSEYGLRATQELARNHSGSKKTRRGEKIVATRERHITLRGGDRRCSLLAEQSNLSTGVDKAS